MFENTEGLFSIEEQTIEPYPEPSLDIWHMNSVPTIAQAPIVIGFAGYRRMGKSLSARLLTEALPSDSYTVATHNFAEPIRKFADQFLDLSITPEMTELDKESPIQRLREKSPRQIMQMTGDFFKSIHPDYFTNYMRRLITSFEPEPETQGVFLIDDVRFEKEVELIREFSGVIWEMHEVTAGSKTASRQHNSDMALPRELIDLEIKWSLDKTNPLGSIAELRALVHIHFNERFTH